MLKYLTWQFIKHALIVTLLVAVIIIIAAYPQHVGDTKLGDDGKMRVYWRGKNPNEPGRWVFLVKDGNGKATVDSVPLNKKEVLYLYDDDTAAILPVLRKD